MTFVRLSVLFLALAWASPSTAAPTVTTRDVVGQVVQYTIYGEAGSVDIAIGSQGVTVLTFAGEVTKAYRIPAPDPGSPIGIYKNKNDILLYATRGDAENTRVDAVFGTDGLTVNANIRITPDPLARVRSATFVQRPLSEAPREPGAPHLPAPMVDYVALAKEQLLGHTRITPVVRYAHDAQFGLELGDAVTLNGRLYASFSLTSPASEPLVLGAVRVRDANGQVHLADMVSLDAPAIPASGSIAAIPPGQRASGVVLVPEARYGDIGPQSFMFEAQGGLGTAIAEADEWVFVLKKQSEIDATKREYALRGWWSLHAAAGFGATWLPASVTLVAAPFELNDTDETTFTSFGLRTTYSLTSWLLFDGEAVYASTGEARFGNLTLANGKTGELVRSLQAGRLIFGLLVRLRSEGINIVLRGGAGIQLGFYRAEIGGMGAEDGDGFELKPLWYFGPALVIPVGKRCALTIVTAYTRFSKEEQSAGIGPDFGCAWKP